MKNKMLVGSLEKCDLPGLMIEGLHIRVDTGATTSSLHVDNIEPFRKDGDEWISYDIHPDIHDVDKIVTRQSKVVDIRVVKSSSGERQNRYVIETPMVLGGEQWDILITLTDRSSMNYLMLLGRQAMNGHVIVDPELEYQLNS